MDKKENTTTDKQEQARFTRFLDRLRILPYVSKFPIRTWMTWLGVVLFVALVIAYYALGGGN